MCSFLEFSSRNFDTRVFPAAGREYKSAIRALIPLLHSSGDADQVVKLAAMEEAIPKSNGRAWRTIKEKLQHGKISALEDLDEKTRTLAQFTRVNSYVQGTEAGWLTVADAGFSTSVGAKRAEKFYEEGFRTLDQLKTREKLTHAQKMGLQYFKASLRAPTPCKDPAAAC